MDAFGHYEKGLERAKQKDYPAALREFIVAYDISPHFAVLYNIGQCHVLLGQASQAVEALSRYLGDGRYLVPAERRRQVGDQVAQLAAGLNPPPSAITDRALEKAAQDAAVAAELAGQAATRAAKAAHAAAVAARLAAAAVRASRSRSSVAAPVEAQESKR